MDTHVNSPASQYFRCYRLAATITPQQCRVNRDVCLQQTPRIDPIQIAFVGAPTYCCDCPQALLVDASAVPLFTLPQVVAGLARQEPQAPMLPGQYRPSVHHSADMLTSHFWVPEWDF